jgi:hypothetical protein
LHLHDDAENRGIGVGEGDDQVRAILVGSMSGRSPESTRA